MEAVLKLLASKALPNRAWEMTERMEKKEYEG